VIDGRDETCLGHVVFIGVPLLSLILYQAFLTGLVRVSLALTLGWDGRFELFVWCCTVQVYWPSLYGEVNAVNYHQVIQTFVALWYVML